MSDQPDPNSSRRLVAAGIGLALLGGTVAWRAWRRGPAPAQGPEQAAEGRGAATVVDDSQPVPEFKVTAAGGERTRNSLLGHWSIVFFGYTQCPDVCPGSLTMLREALAPLPAAQRPAVLFISVDPARDTAELLAQYVPAFDPSFEGAAGSDDSIAALVKHLGVHYERHAPDARGLYTVDHTASLFLIDPQARLKAVFSPPHDAAAVAAALRRLTA